MPAKLVERPVGEDQIEEVRTSQLGELIRDLRRARGLPPNKSAARFRFARAMRLLQSRFALVAVFTRLRNASLATMACTSAGSEVPSAAAARTTLRTTGSS